MRAMIDGVQSRGNILLYHTRIRLMLRSTTLGAFAVILSLTALSAGAQERATAMQATAVRRTTLLVDNIEKSIDFYQR